MKRSLIRKLGSTRGESLVEVLVSMLITALSVALLATMINTSVNLTRRSEEKLQEYYLQNTVLDQQTSSGTPLEFSVAMKDKDGVNVCDDFHVVYFENDVIGKYPVISYKIK